MFALRSCHARRLHLPFASLAPRAHRTAFVACSTIPPPSASAKRAWAHSGRGGAGGGRRDHFGSPPRLQGLGRPPSALLSDAVDGLSRTNSKGASAEDELRKALQAAHEAVTYYSHARSFSRVKPLEGGTVRSKTVGGGGGGDHDSRARPTARTLADAFASGGDASRRHGSCKAEVLVSHDVPTAQEEREGSAMATLLQWVAVCAARTSRQVLLRRAPRGRASTGAEGDLPLWYAVRRVLLPGLEAAEAGAATSAERGHYTGFADSFSTSHLLSESLARRAAKSYVELMVQHRVRPASTEEWAQLCRVLTVVGKPFVTVPLAARGAPSEGSGSKSLMVLPLLPSGLRREGLQLQRPGSGDEGCKQEELHLLSQMMSWQQAKAILDWGVEFSRGHGGSGHGEEEVAAAAGAHVSSQDVLFAVTRLVQDTGSREVRSEVAEADELDDGEDEEAYDGAVAPPLVEGTESATVTNSSDPALPAELKRLWEASRAAERACPPLARACGLAHTIESTLSLTGKKVVLTGGAAVAAATVEAKVFNERLLQGDWRGVLAAVVAQAQAYNARHGIAVNHPVAPEADEEAPHRQRRAHVEQLLRDGLAEAASTESAPLDELDAFFRAGAGEQGRVPVQLFGTPRHALHTRLPRDYAAAAVTREEVELLAGSTAPQHTPQGVHVCAAAAGLVPQPQPPASLDAVICAVEASLREQQAQQALAGRHATATPAAVVELRRRLWQLAQLPRHLPRRLVRFASHPVSTLPRAGPSDAVVAGPYLLRSPQRELLPWLLASVVGLVVETALQDTFDRPATTPMEEGRAKALLGELRAFVAPTLFTLAKDYAAFQDYTYDLFLQLGSVTAELACDSYWRRHRRRKPTVCSNRSSPDAARTAETVARTVTAEVLFLCAKTLFKPPPPPPPQTPLLQVSSPQPDFDPHRCVCSANNYFASLYLELLASLAPSLADFAKARDELLTGQPNHLRVVLGPEAAAVITTAIALRLAPAASARRQHGSAPMEDDWLPAAVAKLVGGGQLYFAVPANKAHAVASYLKGIYDPCYVEAPFSDSPAEGVCEGSWDGPEAWLVGRSLRFLSRHPATTTDAFFHVRAAAGTGVVMSPPPPRLAWRVYAVNTVKAVERFAQGIPASRLQDGKESCQVVALGDTTAASPGGGPATRMPYGLSAVYKPAGVNTTLHAGYDSLVSFLSQALPWEEMEGSGKTRGTTVDEILRDATIPVRHQHGLVNRIDVGTSGLVLVAATAAGLHHGRLHTLARRHAQKTYHAFVQYAPPLAAAELPRPRPTRRSGDIAAFFSASPSPSSSSAAAAVAEAKGAGPRLWFLPLQGVVSSPVMAAAGPRSIVANPSNVRAGKAVATLDWRPALTKFRVVEFFPKSGVSLVEVRLSSGRRHQIRQHMAQLQHPLLGDDRYCVVHRYPHPLRELFTRPALHASGLDIIAVPDDGDNDNALPGAEGEVLGTRVVVQCPLPADMRKALHWLRREERAGRRAQKQREGPTQGP